MTLDEITRLMTPIVAALVLEQVKSALASSHEHAIQVFCDNGFLNVEVWEGQQIETGVFQRIRRIHQTRVLITPE